MKTIEKLAWKPWWISHLGCLKGCLEYQQADISDAWLYGASGHAFILNIHSKLCPSGPTAWRKEQFLNLIQNVGIDSDAIVSYKTMIDFPEKQKLVWDRVRQAVDAQQPCFGWEFGMPEYYIVTGYDDTGYYFSGPKPSHQPVEEPLPWQNLGKTEIGIIEVYFTGLTEPLDDRQILKDAMKFADDFKSSPTAWVFQEYQAGLAGYEMWISALQTKRAEGFGNSYNAAVWAECREFAEKFMIEAEQRIGGDLAVILKETGEHYGNVARSLADFSRLFPFPGKDEDVQDPDRCQQGMKLLKEARDAEEKALDNVSEILEKIG